MEGWLSHTPTSQHGNMRSRVTTPTPTQADLESVGAAPAATPTCTRFCAEPQQVPCVGTVALPPWPSHSISTCRAMTACPRAGLGLHLLTKRPRGPEYSPRGK